MNKIELTEEQKKCVEYPLDKQVLVIEANPGTGKTEVLKHRIIFIHRQNEQQRKLILVLAYGRNIARAIRSKLRSEKLKVYDQLKKILPEIKLKNQQPCLLKPPCPTCLERMKPIVLVCTIHSLANGITDLVIRKQFKEKKKVQIFADQHNSKQKESIIHTTATGQQRQFIWNAKKRLTSRKSKLFNYLLSTISPEYLDSQKRKKLWEIFQRKGKQDNEQENVTIIPTSTPYYHYNINYDKFLAEVSFSLPHEKELLVQLKNSCQHDQEKNIWLDYDDIIANASSFIAIKKQKIWPEFDYILVDECQDLKKQVLNLVIQIFGHQQTNFTFVGDPKQNIMGFAGATEDIFELLAQEFPNLARSTISVSFRLPEEIAALANHFIAKFMAYRVAIETVKSNGGYKPQIFIVGHQQDYQLNQSEVKEIKQELNSFDDWGEKELEKLNKNLSKKKERNKRLRKHLNIILPIIDQLGNSTTKAILYRKNWVGELLQEWLRENGRSFLATSTDKLVNNIIRKVRINLKSQSFAKFKSFQNWLNSLEIDLNGLPQLVKMVVKLDQENSLTNTYLVEEKIHNLLTKFKEELTRDPEKNTEGINLSTIHGAKGLEFDHVFLIFCDKNVLPRKEKFTNFWEGKEEMNLFFTAITRPKIRLYITTSCQEECSDFISPANLKSDLIELTIA